MLTAVLVKLMMSDSERFTVPSPTSTGLSEKPTTLPLRMLPSPSTNVTNVFHCCSSQATGPPASHTPITKFTTSAISPGR